MPSSTIERTLPDGTTVTFRVNDHLRLTGGIGLTSLHCGDLNCCEIYWEQPPKILATFALLTIEQARIVSDALALAVDLAEQWQQEGGGAGMSGEGRQ